MQCSLEYESLKGHEEERSGYASVWVQDDGHVAVIWKAKGHFKVSSIGLRMTAAEMRTLAEDLNLAADELDGGLNMGP